jgi:lysophospholipase L1-like esterase
MVSTVALFALAAVPASAASEGHDYLALGDSVPFGFSPLLNPNDASNFIGYPEIVAQRLDIKDVNATCPGEATGGFLSLTGTDNVCRPYRASFPLHTQYGVSQMDYALRYLTGHKDTRLITLTLGANDLFRWQKDCKVTPQPFGTCPLGFGGVLAVMQANLHTIFLAIRSTGYTGLIVAVSYYALDYNSPLGALALQAQIASAGSTFSVKLASGFNAWAPVAATAGGDSCAAGLLIRTSATGCDVHPTPLGRDLLAGAVINTIAASCPAHDAVACLDLNR